MKYLVPFLSAAAYLSVIKSLSGPHHFVGISAYGKFVTLTLITLWWLSCFIDTLDRQWNK